MQPPVALQPPATTQPTVVSSVQARNASAYHTETGRDKKEVKLNSAAPSTGTKERGSRKDILLSEGTVSEHVLINRLEGQFAGPVRVSGFTTDVYSNDRQHLLIPAGSKILGETRKVENFGQTRLAVVFHRLLMPDGFS